MRAVTSDDEVNMIVRFADGDLTEDATGIVSLSMTEYPKYQNRVEFFGDKGAMRIEHRGEIFIGKKGDDDWREFDSKLGKTVEGVPDTGFARGFMEFAPKIIDAIRNGKPAIEYAATFEDGLKVQVVLDAARESNEKGAMVKIESEARFVGTRS
jgi:predicted dehydrogenase